MTKNNIMATFKSAVKTIPASVQSVYASLSNLSNFATFAESAPADLRGKVDFEVKDDFFTIKTNQIGDISFVMSKKVEDKLITLETVSGSSPLPFAIDLNMEESGEATNVFVETRIELNPIVKAMVSKPIQDMTDKFAELLTILSYSK